VIYSGLSVGNEVGVVDETCDAVGAGVESGMFEVSDDVGALVSESDDVGAGDGSAELVGGAVGNPVFTARAKVVSGVGM